jgi:hypothetical protein
MFSSVRREIFVGDFKKGTEGPPNKKHRQCQSNLAVSQRLGEPRSLDDLEVNPLRRDPVVRFRKLVGHY